MPPPNHPRSPGPSVALFGVGLVVAGCVSPPAVVDVALEVRFDTAARAASAVRVELELRQDSCSGPIVPDGSVTFLRADAGLPGAMRLPAGTYCGRARAFDRGCVEFGAGEVTFEAGASSVVVVEVRPTDVRRECLPTACVAGRCVASLNDAGVDAPPDVRIELPDWGPIELPDTPPPDTPPPDVGPPDDLGVLPVGCRAEPASLVTAGAEHTCALVAGSARCWGRDDEGRLGAGDVRFESRVPVPVAGGLSFSTLSAGGAHTCGIAAGVLYCWGDNQHGQLGLGTIDAMPHPTPAAVPGDTVFSSVSAGAHHTCAIGQASGVASLFCWGAGDARQLGTAAPGPDVPSPRVVPLPGGLTPGLVDLGDDHGCVVGYGDTIAEQRLFCFGAPGPWAGAGSGPPTEVLDGGGELFQALGVGARHGCVTRGVFGAAQTLCWGSGAAGRLGTGDTMDHPIPVAVTTETFPPGIAAGGDFTCWARGRGDPFAGEYLPGFVACAGAGVAGATGPMGLGRDASTPVVALEYAAFAFGTGAIAAGADHACAASPDGLVCWGDNAYGQLGTGTAEDLAASPRRVCFY